MARVLELALGSERTREIVIFWAAYAILKKGSSVTMCDALAFDGDGVCFEARVLWKLRVDAYQFDTPSALQHVAHHALHLHPHLQHADARGLASRTPSPSAPAKQHRTSYQCDHCIRRCIARAVAWNKPKAR